MCRMCRICTMDAQKVTLLVLLDLSAAFDTVRHDILLDRLRSRLGVTDQALNCLTSYFSRDASGAFRASSCGRSGRGGQPRLPNAGRFDVHVRAAQARSERVLRQALGVAGRHPHGAARVSPVVV